MPCGRKRNNYRACCSLKASANQTTQSGPARGLAGPQTSGTQLSNQSHDAARIAKEAWTEDALDGILDEMIHDPSVWTARAQLLVAINAVISMRTTTRRARSFWNSVKTKTFSFDYHDGVYRVYSGENHRRALAPRPSPRDTVAVRVVVDLRSETAPLRRMVKRFPRNLRPVVRRQIAIASAYNREVHATLRTRPNAPVVVTGLESQYFRAFGWAARELGYPTVYVPHAPTAHARCYRDLFTDYALLRGSNDVEYYARLGASRDRLFVSGDASVPNRSSLPRTNRFAFTGTDDQTVDATAEVLLKLQEVAEANALQFSFFPHPASTQELPPIPGVVIEGRRFAEYAAAESPSFVLSQAASGSLLEAAYFGATVGRLSACKNYLFEDDLIVTPHEDIRTVGKWLSTPSGSEQEVNMRKSRNWIAIAGQDAVEAQSNALACIRDSSRTSESRPLIDAYGRADPGLHSQT